MVFLVYLARSSLEIIAPHVHLIHVCHVQMANWVEANVFHVPKESMHAAVNVQTAHHHANPATMKRIAYHVLKSIIWSKIIVQMSVHWIKFLMEQFVQHVWTFVQSVIYKTPCVLSVHQVTIFMKADVSINVPHHW